MDLRVRIDGVEKAVSVERRRDDYVVTIGGRQYVAKSPSIQDGVVNFLVGTRTYRALVSRNPLGTQITFRGRDYFLKRADEDKAATFAGMAPEGDGAITAPMPGNIIAVHVEVGDDVTVGDAVVVVESMKMQNEITATVSGKVRSVLCKAGDQVAFGALLLEIKPEGAQPR